MSGRHGAKRQRLPDCMVCVLDHLAPGLPPGEQAMLIRMARYAHNAGCGMYPGQRRLARELAASEHTLRYWRDNLIGRRLLDRLPRVGPRGADLYRLRLCPDCQRGCMEPRCGQCQRGNLQHAESEWWAAQRGSMQPQKKLGLQGEPAATPDHHDGQAVPGKHLWLVDPGAGRRPPDPAGPDPWATWDGSASPPGPPSHAATSEPW
jgi:hypothetical protein